jgi:hypothetical protein
MVAQQLVNPRITELPAVESLGEFLFSAPPHQIPVTPQCYEQLQADPACATLLPHFTDDTSPYQLAEAFTQCVRAVANGKSEPWTADHVNRTVVAVLTALDRLLPSNMKVGLNLERDEGDTESGMTQLSAKLKALRPDGLIRHVDGIRMLFKWEEKGVGGIAGALKDIITKAAPEWPEIFYGQLQYVLSFAVAGPLFQFCSMSRGHVGNAELVGAQLNLDELQGRAQLALTLVQLYRYLVAVSAILSQTVAAVNKQHKRKVDRITRIM